MAAMEVVKRKLFLFVVKKTASRMIIAMMEMTMKNVLFPGFRPKAMPLFLMKVKRMNDPKTGTESWSIMVRLTVSFVA